MYTYVNIVLAESFNLVDWDTFDAFDGLRTHAFLEARRPNNGQMPYLILNKRALI